MILAVIITCINFISFKFLVYAKENEFLGIIDPCICVYLRSTLTYYLFHCP